MRGGCRIQARGKGRIIVTVVKLKPRPINSPVVGPEPPLDGGTIVFPLSAATHRLPRAHGNPWKLIWRCVSYRQIAPLRRFEARRENGRLLAIGREKESRGITAMWIFTLVCRDKTRVGTVLSPLICINPTGSIPWSLSMIGIDSIRSISMQFRSDFFFQPTLFLDPFSKFILHDGKIEFSSTLGKKENTTNKVELDVLFASVWTN